AAETIAQPLARNAMPDIEAIEIFDSQPGSCARCTCSDLPGQRPLRVCGCTQDAGTLGWGRRNPASRGLLDLPVVHIGGCVEYGCAVFGSRAYLDVIGVEHASTAFRMQVVDVVGYQDA